MSYWMRLGLLLVLLSGLVPTLGPASAAVDTVPVTVTITLVENTGGGLEGAGRGDPDFYAGVTIDGRTMTSFEGHPHERSRIEPFWVFTNDVPETRSSAEVVVQIWDHDDCSRPFCSDFRLSGRNDDQGDLDPDFADDRNLDLEVDLDTGRWTGDADWPTNCSEGDGGNRVLLCWDVSVLSSNGDADGDGLLDGWETHGFNADGVGGIDVDLPGFGADPLHKDLFLEFDWMSGFAPSRSEMQKVKAAFSAAPVDAGGTPNPDGSPGINIWIDTGGLMDGASLVADDLGGGNAIPASKICNLNSKFYDAKRNNFDFDRQWIFRYAIKADPDDCDSGGWGEVGGNDFILYNNDGGSFMHELGHNLNLRHGGDEGRNCKPNYVSVMNYDLQFGIPQAGGGKIYDYAPPRFSGGRGSAPLADLEENDLDERIILDPTDSTNRTKYTDDVGRKVQTQLDVPIDWNGDGDTNDPPTGDTLKVNIDTKDASSGEPDDCGNGSSSRTLTGFDDWSAISIPFRQFGDAKDGPVNPPHDITDPTTEELLQQQQDANTTDVSIDKADDPDPAVAGEEVVYTLTVTNHGPNPSSDTQVVDHLPDEVTYQSDDAGCTEGPPGTLTCDLGELMAGEQRQIEITALVDADLVHRSGGPTTITNEVSVENRAGPDPEPDNNGASEDTEVVAEADLGIVEFEGQDPPTELLVGQEREVVLRKVVTSEGPSSPMDAEVEATAVASSGGHVRPASITNDVPALEDGEERTVRERFTIGCEEPGIQSFTFANEISPEDSADTDPQSGNNLAETGFEVDCILPVAVNIKPGSDPNSVNPRGNGAIPVAVLSTEAGEYGLPMAFDATTIDALSVRFGPPEVIGEGSGARETHHRGHPEDSFELDEETKDGDTDLVLHFRTQESGISDDSEEACVKGEWIDPDGDRLRFFGCDDIRTVGGRRK